MLSNIFAVLTLYFSDFYTGHAMELKYPLSVVIVMSFLCEFHFICFVANEIAKEMKIRVFKVKKIEVNKPELYAKINEDDMEASNQDNVLSEIK